MGARGGSEQVKIPSRSRGEHVELSGFWMLLIPPLEEAAKNLIGGIKTNPFSEQQPASQTTFEKALCCFSCNRLMWVTPLSGPGILISSLSTNTNVFCFPIELVDTGIPSSAGMHKHEFINNLSCNVSDGNE